MNLDISLYRRWRPRSFDEVVGQKHIVKTLKNMVNSGKINHAYLFTGPRGTGKTSVARILARAINCLSIAQGNPCGKCTNCINLLEGSNLDVLEIDAASNRGIDEIKELRSKVNYTPANLKFKVYIIDEVHMLTSEAFNALLKTLEEPPSFVVFVLATTEPHKVPLTIASRCLRFDFRNLSEEDMFILIKKVCEYEKYIINEQSLAIIIEASQGSLRDALTYLEQVESFAGKEMKDDDVYMVLGIPSPQWVKEYLKYLLLNKGDKAINKIDELVNFGRDFRQSARQIIIQLRNLIMTRMGETSKSFNTNEELLLTTQHLNFEEFIPILDRLIILENDLRFSLDPRLTFELFTLKEIFPENIKFSSREVVIQDKTEESKNITEIIDVLVNTDDSFSLDNFVKFIKEVKKQFVFGSMLELADSNSYLDNELTLFYRLKEKAQHDYLKKEKMNIEKLLSEYIKKPAYLSLKIIPEKNIDYDIKQDPIVKKAMDLFEGSTVEFRKIDDYEK